MSDEGLPVEQGRGATLTPRSYAPGVTLDAHQATDLDDFDVRGALRQLFASIAAHKVLILLCGLAAAGLMQAYFKLFPPVYEAKVMVLAESDKDVVREEYYKLWSTFRKNDLDSDIELSTAFPVVRRVVDKLGLKYDDVYHPPLAHAMYLWEQSWIGNQYRRIKEWFFPKEPDPYALSPEMELLARTVRDFREGASLAPVPGSHVGNMIVRGPSPRVATYANTLIDEFIADRRRQFAEEAQGAYDALSRETDRAYADLTKAQEAVAAFESRNALMLGFQKEEVLMGQWVELGLGIANLEARLASQERALDVVTSNLSKEPEELDASSMKQASEVKEEMRAHLFKLKNNLRQARTRMTAEAPEVRELEALIAQTEASINEEPEQRDYATTRSLNQNHLLLRQSKQGLEKSLAGLRAEIASRRETYTEIGKKLEVLPKLKFENAMLQQDLNAAGTRHKLLRERLMMARVSLDTVDSVPSTFKIISYALPPGKPVWPKKKLFMLVAIVVGLLGGVAIGLFVDMVSNIATRDRLAVRQDLPVFGTIQLDAPRRALLPGGAAAKSRRRAIEHLKNGA